MRTIEDVKKEFIKYDYIVTSKEYKNNKQRIEYICPNNHTHYISWSNWTKGRRCPYCSGVRSLTTIGGIKKEFEKYSYILLTTKYINNRQKLKFICPRGHVGYISWDKFRRGGRCGICYGHKEVDLDYIKKIFEIEEYVVLDITKKPKGRHLIDFICPEGHIGNISWNNFSMGARCKECGVTKSGISQRVDGGYVIESFEQEDYEVLAMFYLASRLHIRYKCPNGHIRSIAWYSWKNGNRCLKCYNRTYTEEELKEWKNYRRYVDNLTKQNYTKYKKIIDPDNLWSGGLYHLDHIYCVIAGFCNNISVEIIASPVNLQVILAEENLRKGRNSHISEYDLYTKYNKFINP